MYSKKMYVLIVPYLIAVMLIPFDNIAVTRHIDPLIVIVDALWGTPFRLHE